MIIWMFEEIKGFMGRLNCHNQQEITEAIKKLIVDILGQLLMVLGVATKRMKQNRLGRRFQCSSDQKADIFKSNLEEEYGSDRSNGNFADLIKSGGSTGHFVEQASHKP